jgi:hypothetical protein
LHFPPGRLGRADATGQHALEAEAFPQGDVAASARGDRLRHWIIEALSYKQVVPAIICLGVMLTSSYVSVGRTGDDFFHAVALRDQPGVAGTARAPWDLFSFATPSSNPALMKEGAFPWWTDPDLVVSFYRPLSSLSHWVEHALWPDNEVLMHVHSMFWFALLLGAAGLVYRELSLSPRHAALALLLYAIDDARAEPVAWIAQRNALIALAPAFLALAAHHRWRAGGSKLCAWLAPLSLLIGLQGGESALSVCGYLFAYALIMERGSWRARARSLLPYLAVVLLWRVVYNYLGKGALHSGIYIDPGRDPLECAENLLVRMPILLLSQYALPFSDFWEAYPMFSPWLRPLVLAFALGVLGVLGWLLSPLLRARPLLRFWLLGSLLATIPVCAVHPEDRMLTSTSLGAAALIAAFLMAIVEKTYARPSRPALGAAFALGAVHLLIAPLLLPVRSFDIFALGRLMAHSYESIPSGPEAEHQTVVLINPPVDVFAVYFPVYRSAYHIPRPEHFRWLATGESDLYVERVDAQTLRVRPLDGFLATGSQVMFRRADHTMQPGEHVNLGDVEFTVTKLLPDARPAEVLVHFNQKLESRSLRFLQWGVHEYISFRPPPVGHSVVIPKVDLAGLLNEADEHHHS